MYCRHPVGLFCAKRNLEAFLLIFFRSGSDSQHTLQHNCITHSNTYCKTNPAWVGTSGIGCTHFTHHIRSRRYLSYLTSQKSHIYTCGCGVSDIDTTFISSHMNVLCQTLRRRVISTHMNVPHLTRRVMSTPTNAPCPLTQRVISTHINAPCQTLTYVMSHKEI